MTRGSNYSVHACAARGVIRASVHVWPNNIEVINELGI